LTYVRHATHVSVKARAPKFLALGGVLRQQNQSLPYCLRTMVIVTLRHSRLWGDSRMCVMARQRHNLLHRILNPVECHADDNELIWIFNISKW